MNNNKMYNLLIIIFILIVVFLELTFNFSSILMNNYKETFDVLDSASESLSDDIPSSIIEKLKPSDTKPVKSIISKNSGKVINIQPLGVLPTSKFLLKINSECLSMNEDGTYGLGICNRNSLKQHFNLIFIRNESDFKNIIPITNIGRGSNRSLINYPYYMCIPEFDKSKCLQFDVGYLNIRPIGNYDNQKWDIDYNQIDNNVSLNDNVISPQPLSFSNYVGDKPNTFSGESTQSSNKIKLNLNLNKDIINSLLNLNKNNSILNHHNLDNKQNDETNITKNTLETLDTKNIIKDIENTDEKIDLGTCDRNNWLPRNSIKSLCPGCDPELLK